MRRSIAILLLVAVTLAPVAPTSHAAAASQAGRIAVTAQGRLVTANPDGTGARPVLAETSLENWPASPRFSHDGSKIAFNRGSSMCVTGVDGSGRRCLSSGGGPADAYYAAAWSPDDRLIYAISDGRLAAFSLDGLGFDESPLDGLEDRHVSSIDWSPDGRRYVVSSGSGRDLLRIGVGAPGEPVVDLTAGPGIDGHARWSPDGRRIVFSTHRDMFDRTRVVVIEADGSGRRVLAENALPYGWSPDGSKILYGSEGVLYTVNPDGTGSAPIPGVAGSADWTGGSAAAVMAAGGGAHTLVVRADGTVSARGMNVTGQLGDGTRDDRTTPVAVAGLPPTATVAAGWLHSAAATNDGRAWTWGWNGAGQLGSGTRDDSATPRAVPGLDGVVAVAAGMAHTVALKGDGTVWTWGWNALGQLGDGSTTDRLIPVQVPVPGTVMAVAAGAVHTVALGRGGAMWSWGHNGYGQLGAGSTVDSASPLPVQLPFAPGTAVAAGLFHTVSVGGWHNEQAWGWNGLGQLGDGSTLDRASPVSSGPAAMEGTSPAAGAGHSLLASPAGSLWTWGFGELGQTGQPGAGTVEAPERVAVASPVWTVAAGWFHSVAVSFDGRVLAWGHNGSGQLGDGSTTTRVEPVVVAS